MKNIDRIMLGLIAGGLLLVISRLNKPEITKEVYDQDNYTGRQSGTWSSPLPGTLRIVHGYKLDGVYSNRIMEFTCTNGFTINYFIP